MKMILRIFCLCALLCAPVMANDAPETLYLSSMDPLPEFLPVPILVREMYRQGLLIAARDEMGLHTRDATLREWSKDQIGKLPADANGKPALLLNVLPTQKPNFLDMYAYTLNPAPVELLHDPVSIGRIDDATMSIPKTLELLEPLSRTKFVELLKGQKYTVNIKPKGALDAPAGVDHLLYQTTLLAPYSAVQQTHAAIRESGESPQRLSALVRGYANLGELTRFQWCPTQKVMTARSLLYAQRMVSQAPDSPFSYWNRAYAFAMTGLYADALADLDKARQLRAGAGDKPLDEIPKWVPLLKPCCTYDLEKLAGMAAKTDPRTPLIALMVFTDVEHCGSLSQLMAMGGASLDVDGRCFRIMDGMMDHAGVISGHELSERAPAVMLQTLPDDIKLLAVVPKATQDALAAAQGSGDHVANLESVSKSFLNATETAEPSFALAGRLVQETNFVHVMRRASFMADAWSVDCSDYLDAIAPLIADHPYRAYVQALKFPRGLRASHLEKLEIENPQWQMASMLLELRSLPVTKGHSTGIRGWNNVHVATDPTGHDLEQALTAQVESRVTSRQDTKFEQHAAAELLAIAPLSSLGAGTQVKVDFATAEPQLAEWSNTFHNKPAFLSALADHYLQANQPDKAEPLLKDLVNVAPDRAYVERLAKIYLARNDEAQWLSTMKLVLAAPDYRLDHSYAEAEIAYHYMHREDFETARKYAEASYNDSASQWSMQCLQLAAECQGDFTTAEKVVKEETERYEPICWFTWCERTGHGDLTQAKQIADQWVAAHSRPTNVHDLEMAAYILDAEGKTDQSRPFYEVDMKQVHDAESGIIVAFDDMGKNDKTAAAAALKFVTDNCAVSLSHQVEKTWINFAQFLLDNPNKLPTDQELDAMIDGEPHIAQKKCSLYYLRGRLQEINGDHDGAKKSFQIAVQQPAPGPGDYTLACIELHKMGEKTPLPTLNEW